MELTLTNPASAYCAVEALVLDSVSSPKTKTLYSHAIREFMTWFRAEQPGPLSKAVVQRYRTLLEGRGLSASSINVRMSAVRKLAVEAGDNGLLAPEVAAGIVRVKGARRLGLRLGNWLSQDQAQALLSAP